ncbi:MAG: hypothetical protein ACTSUK_00980, partial [Promethearchaeota archaeon]
NKLLQFTQWKPHYLNEILEGMVSKNFIQIEENVITSPGLITQEELAELNDHFKKVEQKKKEKALEKAKLAEEKRKFEQSLKEKKKKQEEKRLKEQQEKLLQEARLKAQKEAQKARKTAEKQSEQEDMERLKKIKATPRPKIQTLPNKPEKTSLPKSIATPPEVNHDFDDKVQIIENVFAKFKPSTGGLIVFQALRYYSQQEGMQEMLDSEWTDLIQELKNRHIIIREIEQSGVQAFLFENLELSDECIKIIKQFILHGEMNYQEMEQALGWKTQQIEPFIKRLYEINLIKYNQREKFYFPGLFNTQ